MDHPDVVSDLASSEEIRALFLSNRTAMERLNAEVQLDNSDDVRRQGVQEFLVFAKQMQIIPDDLFFELFNDDDIDQVLRKLSRYAKQVQIAQQEAAQEQQKQQAIAGIAAMRAQNDMQRQEIEKDASDAATSIAKIEAQGRSNIAQEGAKAALAPKEKTKPPTVEK